jgi:hypothetical protein
MPDPGKIPISDARLISHSRGCPLVVIFGIEEGRDRFTITTYGQTKHFCKLAASFGEQFAEAIFDGTVSPPQTEPFDLPETPATYAGICGTTVPAGWLKEVLARLRELAAMPSTEQTAAEAVHFARAALAVYDVRLQEDPDDA